MISVPDAWQSLLPATGVNKGWKSIRIFPDAPFPIRAAIEEPMGRRALLFEFHASSVSAIREYPSANGFMCFTESLKSSPSDMVRLCLVLVPSFDPELFGRLAQDVAETAASTNNEVDGVKVFLARLNAWQIFLRKHEEGLTHEEQIGLFAEIAFFRHTIKCGLHPIIATAAWRGPEGGLRDFEFDDCEIEVKATLGAHRTLRISHLSQLDETGITNLFLCHIFLSLSAEGETLCEIVKSMRAELSEHECITLHQFERLLLIAGYSDHHEKLYELRRYKISSMKIFRVAESFPRIRLNDVLPGVLDGSYIVDVQACQQYLVDMSLILPLIGIK